MKKVFIPIITIGFLMAILALISSWFIDYEPSVKGLIFKTVLCLLGALYGINAVSSKKRGHQIIFMLCGLFIVASTFIERNLITNLLTVIAILTPIIVRRFEAKSGKNQPDIKKSIP